MQVTNIRSVSHCIWSPWGVKFEMLLHQSDRERGGSSVTKESAPLHMYGIANDCTEQQYCYPTSFRPSYLSERLTILLHNLHVSIVNVQTRYEWLSQILIASGWVTGLAGLFIIYHWKGRGKVFYINLLFNWQYCWVTGRNSLVGLFYYFERCTWHWRKGCEWDLFSDILGRTWFKRTGLGFYYYVWAFRKSTTKPNS